MEYWNLNTATDFLTDYEIKSWILENGLSLSLPKSFITFKQDLFPFDFHL